MGGGGREYNSGFNEMQQMQHNNLRIPRKTSFLSRSVYLVNVKCNASDTSKYSPLSILHEFPRWGDFYERRVSQEIYKV